METALWRGAVTCWRLSVERGAPVFIAHVLTRLAPPLTVALLAGPILFGLLGTILPAFGYLPAIGGDRLSLGPFRALLAEPALVRSAVLSLLTGLAASSVSLLIVALLLAGWSGTRTFVRLQALLSPLLALPHAAAAFGLAFLIAPSGFLARLVSPALTGWIRPPDLLIVNDPHGLALVLGLVVKETPFLLLVALAALPQVEAARSRHLAASLGYGRVAGFLFTTWPQVYRQIRLAVFATIVFAASAVDVALILGPSAPQTLSLRLLGWMNDPDLALRFKACAGALLQLGICLLALLAWIAGERLAAILRVAVAEAGYRLRRDGFARFAGLACASLSAGLVFAGLVVLALWSLAGPWPFPRAVPESLTLAAWRTALGQTGSPFATTVVTALLAAAIAVVLAILCLRREDETGTRPGRAAALLLYLPLLLPQPAFLFGLQLLILALRLDATLGALVFIHLVFVLPYVFLSLSDPWRGFDRRYEAVAAGLGRTPGATFRHVRLPMLLRAILTAAALGFAVSVAQYLPTVLIGSGRLVTVTTEAVALAAGGNRRIIGVHAVLQMLLPLAGFAIALAVPALLFRRFRGMRV